MCIRDSLEGSYLLCFQHEASKGSRARRNLYIYCFPHYFFGFTLSDWSTKLRYNGGDEILSSDWLEKGIFEGNVGKLREFYKIFFSRTREFDRSGHSQNKKRE